MSQPWWPTTADVAALLTARTQDSNGDELGDFTADTRPTGGQVTSLIEQAAALVEAATGNQVTTIGPAGDALRSLVALRTAMSVELSYFPEQIGTDTSPFEQLRLMYRDEFDRIVSAVDASVSEGSDAGGGLAAGGARYRFPDPSPPLEF